MERLFNIASAIVFGAFTLVLLYAALFNWVHLIFAACAANLFVAALTDKDESGKSLLDEWKQKRAA